jgi:hypothetical protein
MIQHPRHLNMLHLPSASYDQQPGKPPDPYHVKNTSSINIKTANTRLSNRQTFVAVWNLKILGYREKGFSIFINAE